MTGTPDHEAALQRRPFSPMPRARTGTLVLETAIAPDAMNYADAMPRRAADLDLDAST
jgi:hypothetical protein